MKSSARARTSSLVLTVCLMTACGGSTASNTSGTATTGTATTGTATTGTATTSSPAATAGGGGTSGIPVIADGSFKSGTAHIEISGGRSDTFDLRTAGGFAATGTAAIVFTDNQRTFQLTVTGGGNAAGAVVVATQAYTVGAELGKECQINITRNNATGLSGEVNCKDAAGIALPSTPLTLNIKGTFSADR